MTPPDHPTPPDSPAAVLAWLDTLTDGQGRPLNRDQAAALLGVSRSALFYQSSSSEHSSADKLRPGLLATIEALAVLREASPAQFAALVDRRIEGVKRGIPGGPGRPTGSRRKEAAELASE